MDALNIGILVVGICAGIGALILKLKSRKPDQTLPISPQATAPPQAATRTRKDVPIRHRRRANSTGKIAPAGYYWNETDELFDLDGWLIEGIILLEMLDSMSVVPLDGIAASNEQYAQEIDATPDIPAAEVEHVTESIASPPPAPVHHEPVTPEPERSSWGGGGSGGGSGSGSGSYDSGGSDSGDCGGGDD